MGALSEAKWVPQVSVSHLGSLRFCLGLVFRTAAPLEPQPNSFSTPKCPVVAPTIVSEKTPKSRNTQLAHPIKHRKIGKVSAKPTLRTTASEGCRRRIKAVRDASFFAIATARAFCPLPERTATLYFQPHTLAEAADALTKSGGQILAGGTDFYPALGERPVTWPVIDVSRVAELREIRVEADAIVIGGGATWSEIVRHPLPRCFDALKTAAREIGGIQIQNRGTIAGNLCNASPAADSVPPLLALDARVELVSSAGTRRLALDDFILGNRKTALRGDEILARVVVPVSPRAANARAAFLKLGARKYLVISISMVAAVVQLDDDGCVAQARVAVGSCSAKAQRLPELERALRGLRAAPGIGAMVRSEHLRHLSPIDDLRATADYRRDASLTLVQRTLEICCAGVR